MAQQLRVYTTKENRLGDWTRLYREKVRALRTEHGFEIEAWTVPDRNQFVWLVSRPGTREEFEAADAAYYQLPEHAALHEEALGYLEKGESWFLEPVEGPGS